MGYLALGSFLDQEPIAKREDIPEADKTPQYWADRLAREWSLLGAKDLSAKLLPIFIEFNRMCEAEKAMKNPGSGAGGGN